MTFISADDAKTQMQTLLLHYALLNNSGVEDLDATVNPAIQIPNTLPPTSYTAGTSLMAKNYAGAVNALAQLRYPTIQQQRAQLSNPSFLASYPGLQSATTSGGQNTLNSGFCQAQIRQILASYGIGSSQYPSGGNAAWALNQIQANPRYQASWQQVGQSGQTAQQIGASYNGALVFWTQPQVGADGHVAIVYQDPTTGKTYLLGNTQGNLALDISPGTGRWTAPIAAAFLPNAAVPGTG